jgi:hypothetical protein
LGLHATRSSQGLDSNIVTWRDPIGNAKVGNETKHLGNLKTSQKEIERDSVVVCVWEFWHKNILLSEGRYSELA